MTQNSLYPAFFKLDYSTAFGLHSMIIPTREWNSGVGEISGHFHAWDDSDVDADDMINAFVLLLAPFWPATANFNLYTIYTLASASARPKPVASQPLDVAGTSVSTTWAKAVQKTITFRTDLFGTLRIVMLDVPSGNNFDRVDAFSGDTATNDLAALLGADAWAFSARDNGKITGLVQQATTLNEALRTQYRMK